MVFARRNENARNDRDTADIYGSAHSVIWVVQLKGPHLVFCISIEHKMQLFELPKAAEQSYTSLSRCARHRLQGLSISFMSKSWRYASALRA